MNYGDFVPLRNIKSLMYPWFPFFSLRKGDYLGYQALTEWGGEECQKLQFYPNRSDVHLLTHPSLPLQTLKIFVYFGYIKQITPSPNIRPSHGKLSRDLRCLSESYRLPNVLHQFLVVQLNESLIVKHDNACGICESQQCAKMCCVKMSLCTFHYFIEISLHRDNIKDLIKSWNVKDINCWPHVICHLWTLWLTALYHTIYWTH